MSATLYWQRAKKLKGKDFDEYSPQSVMKILGRGDLELPRTFTEEDIGTLRGMGAARDSRGDGNAFFAELIDAIEQNGAVDVWAEY